jgi:hypothetical protein
MTVSTVGPNVAILAERCVTRELRHVPWPTLAEIQGILQLVLTLLLEVVDNNRVYLVGSDATTESTWQVFWPGESGAEGPDTKRRMFFGARRSSDQ